MIELDTPETIYEALKRVVDGLGGAKVVGHRLRPERPVLEARTWLLNCLNPEHLQKLDPEQVLLLLRWGHEASVHDAINFVCGDAGYSVPTPLTPENALADLQRKAISAAHRSEQANRELFARMKSVNLNVDAIA